MIVVTAPTSQIGSQVVQNLLRAQAPVRVVARDPQRLSPQVREHAEVVTGSHRDPAVVAEALTGADAVFWLVPADPSAPSADDAYSGFARAGIEAFTAQKVGRVVGVSALGRGTAVQESAGYVSATLRMDDAIAATGVPYRALTMPSFMDNTLRQIVPITTQGVFSGPIRPDLPLPLVATRDIAEVAGRLLTDASWTGSEERPVLGPEDLTFEQMAATVADVLGRSVRYQQIPVQAHRDNLLARGSSPAMAQAAADMGRAKNEGLDLGVTRTPEFSTPTTFRQWCQEVLKAAV
ncbi:NAD(P)H-binding protein [Kineosporia succinea]|uniref:Uncharacterized protein YbjT (DUF2867 family) n=1 Tax=Kineosporia succinea TaxID=84632 RepID=A0ABT9PFD4_9ACTN|nr:NAD(P)H-binding protein [Kineosporia succinea]MDP9831196.1 uncharacterized protein YbjT (DUF2867 family) [Kineosporia succinea]